MNRIFRSFSADVKHFVIVVIKSKIRTVQKGLEMAVCNDIYDLEEHSFWVVFFGLFCHVAITSSQMWCCFTSVMQLTACWHHENTGSGAAAFAASLMKCFCLSNVDETFALLGNKSGDLLHSSISAVWLFSGGIGPTCNRQNPMKAPLWSVLSASLCAWDLRDGKQRMKEVLSRSFQDGKGCNLRKERISFDIFGLS